VSGQSLTIRQLIFGLGFVLALPPLAYWGLATFYSIFFFEIGPAWALPLAIFAFAIQVVGMGVARAQTKAGDWQAGQKRIFAQAAGAWLATIAFAAAVWK
jgi:hypothetical protein